MAKNEHKKEQWGSRMGFIFAALGMAVGTGNIWRFPRVAGSNYGGSFIIAYIICNLLWVFPLLMTEMGMGKSTRLGTIGAFRDFFGKKRGWMGTFIAWVCAAITFYYAVVFAQALRYLVFAIQDALKPGMDSQALWDGYLSNPVETLIFTLIANLLMGYFIYKGVNAGLEKLGKIAVPLLFTCLIGISVYCMGRPGATAGLEFLFIPKFEHLLDLKVWLNALTQAAWSAGAGWGMMLTYANYFKDNEDIVVNSAMITFGDMTGAMLGGLAVLPAVFALSQTSEAAVASLQTGNVGLTFITLASLFPTMPGGRIIAILFFLALSLAALTSIVPQAEAVTRNLVNTGMDRKKTAIGFTVVSFLFGIPSALNIDFLNNQDWVYGIGLIVCGIFFALAIYKFGVDKFRTQVLNPPSDFKINKFYNISMYLFPVLFVSVVGFHLWNAAMATPETWWHPIAVENVGTVIAQLLGWAIVFIAANKRINAAITAPRLMDEGTFISNQR